MAFREVGMFEVREVLLQWVKGMGYRTIQRRGAADRKTARRYVEAAKRAGLRRGAEGGEVTDEVVAAVMAEVRPSGAAAHGDAWQRCESERTALKGWIDEGLTVTKIGQLLSRRTGVAVPYRTLHRYATEELEYGGRKTTVRIADGEPGQEVQVDFGRLGWLEEEGIRRRVWGLIFTACYSRHQYVWLTYRQRLEDVITGFEKAWEFFGGVYAVAIPDNMKAIVAGVDEKGAVLTAAFLEYAQARDFVVDAARVRRPKDKPRVERQVPYVRKSFFAGERFASLAEAQERAEHWCRQTAGQRLHGTTQKRPIEVFELEEKAHLGPAPEERWVMTKHEEVTVGRDQHVRFDRALYSVPTGWEGRKVDVHGTDELVRVTWRGQVVKTHPRQAPGGRSTDPADYPAEKMIYATRNAAALEELAVKSGSAVGSVARALLAGPLPWTRMRHVYRLLSLVRTYGNGPVDAACRKALDADAVDVTRIGRMLERALEKGGGSSPSVRPGNVLPFRFQRSPGEFAMTASRPTAPTPEHDDER